MGRLRKTVADKRGGRPFWIKCTQLLCWDRRNQTTPWRNVRNVLYLWRVVKVPTAVWYFTCLLLTIHFVALPWLFNFFTEFSILGWRHIYYTWAESSRWESVHTNCADVIINPLVDENYCSLAIYVFLQIFSLHVVVEFRRAFYLYVEISAREKGRL